MIRSRRDHRCRELLSHALRRKQRTNNGRGDGLGAALQLDDFPLESGSIRGLKDFAFATAGSKIQQQSAMEGRTRESDLQLIPSSLNHLSGDRVLFARV